MDTNRILRVWGSADGYSLEFVYKGDNKWLANVPADLSDGQYVCIFYALKDNQKIGVWTGVLYISDGYSCIHIIEEKYEIEFADSIELCISEDKYNVEYTDKFEITYIPSLEFELEKDCDLHG